MSPLLKTFNGEIDFLAGGTPRLLDETVQQYHLPVHYRKQRPGDAIVERCAHFPDRSPQMVNAGFSDAMTIFGLIIILAVEVHTVIAKITALIGNNKAKLFYDSANFTALFFICGFVFILSVASVLAERYLSNKRSQEK